MSKFAEGDPVRHSRFKWVGSFVRVVVRGKTEGLARCVTDEGRVAGWEKTVFWDPSELEKLTLSEIIENPRLSDAA